MVNIIFRYSFLLPFIALFSTPAYATPQWVTGLYDHPAIQEVVPEKREEVTCVALAIYFEARGESARGQQAVGNVVMNRMRSGRYPATACGVLFQRGQFVFLRGNAPALPKTPTMWERSIKMARSVAIENASDASGGALSFCHRSLRRLGNVIGNHVFYR